MQNSANNIPAFDTARFVLTPLEPDVACQLVEVLMLDHELAVQVPWLAHSAIAGLGHLAEAVRATVGRGLCSVWSVMTRDEEAVVGAVIARNPPDGILVEVLLDADNGEDMDELLDEACDVMSEWLNENPPPAWNPSITLH